MMKNGVFSICFIPESNLIRPVTPRAERGHQNHEVNEGRSGETPSTKKLDLLSVKLFILKFQTFTDSVTSFIKS